MKEEVIKESQEIDEKTQALAKLLAKPNMRSRLFEILRYIDSKKISIDNAIQEVYDKKSGLSKLNRQTLIDIDPEIWKKYIS